MIPVSEPGWIADLADELRTHAAAAVPIEDGPRYADLLPEHQAEADRRRQAAFDLASGALRAVVARSAAHGGWRDGDDWDNSVFRASCALQRVARAPWASPDPATTTEAAKALVLAEAPADGRWGARQHNDKWTSALTATTRDGVQPWRPSVFGGAIPVNPDGTFHNRPATVGALDRQTSAAMTTTTPTDPRNPKRRATVTWASDITMEIAQMLHDHVPLGELTIGAGREGTGKSSYAAMLAAGVSRGTLTGSLHGQPRRVLYLAREDSWAHTIAPRLKAAGADMTKVGSVDVLLDGDKDRPDALNLPEDTWMIDDLVREHDVALIVFDPIVSAMGAGRDNNKQRDVRLTFEPLIQVAHRQRASIFGIAHFMKGQGDPASMISGSHALKDLARSVVVFARDSTTPDGDRVLEQVKNSLGKVDDQPHTYRIEAATVDTADGPSEVAVFRCTGEVSDRSVAEILANNSRPLDSDDGDEIAEWLRAELADQPDCEAPVKVLQAAARNAGHSWDQVKRAKRRIPGYTVTSHPAAGGPAKGGWVWALETEAGK